MDQQSEGAEEIDEDAEQIDDLADSVFATVNNPKVLRVIGDFLKASNEIESKKLEFQKGLWEQRINNDKDVANGWKSVAEKVYWWRFILSILVIAAIVFMGYNKIIEGAVVATLLTGVVASLFIRPEKRE